MRAILKILTALLILLLTLLQDLFGQEIELTVNVSIDQLNFESRRFVSTMKQDIEQYVNNRRWLDNQWEDDKIPVEMNIVLAGGANQKFSARMFLISKRFIFGTDKGASVNLRLYEDKWSFEYMQNASLSHNPLRFDPLTSIIDYYMYLVLGFELDTYEELGGSKAFEMARRVVSLGASYNAPGFDTYSPFGEFTKHNLMSEIQNMRYDPIRKTWFAYYYDALDIMADSPEKGKLAMVSVINELYEFKKNKLSGPSVLLQLFFDTKAQELSEFFKGYNNPDAMIFEKLIYLDPGNSTIYREAKGK